MNNTTEPLKISIDDYLQSELIRETKHEYINGGKVFAMAGAKRWHNIIGMNLSHLLSTHLRGTPCQVYGGI
ncbi:MAG: hypothetical protein Q9M50_01925 [Methylococcales bacterium]|nr:hypothetical protein [Methylococcales bacterium]